MSRKRIGVLTIGQAPRTDVIPFMNEMLPGVEIVEAGILDDLQEEEIRALAPHQGDYVLVTRLRDGQQVTLSRERILARMQALITRLAEHADLVLILCGAEFPPFRCPRPLVEPSRILRHVVASVAEGRRLGVVVPLPAQVGEAEKRWRQITGWVGIEVASPYQNADFSEVGRALRERVAEVVVIDGMAYTRAHKSLVSASSGLPTILAASAVAKVLSELVS